MEINVPRETAVYVGGNGEEISSDSPIANRRTIIAKAAAFIPSSYIPDSPQRIEMYRKLAQVSDCGALVQLKREFGDRFGRLPPPVELLLSVSELKLLASERHVTAIETKADKLMLTRSGDYITLGGKFPRLAKKEAKARLGEIKKMLLAVSQ